MSEKRQGVDVLIQEAFDMCFKSEKRDDIERGRIMLERAAEMGRDDALLYLGKSFEESEDFESAAKYYDRGRERRYRAAIYRLALLHGQQKLSDSDRDFYLRVIQRLAHDQHAPSIARYTNERIRGSYGVFQIFSGLLAFIPNFLRVALYAFRDPNSAKFEK